MQIRMQGKNLLVLNNFLDEIFGDELDGVFSSHAFDCLCKHIKKWSGDVLSEDDVRQFVGAQTSNQIVELLAYRHKGRKFSAAELQAGRESLLEKLTDELRKLPHSCTINFSLPHFSYFSKFPIDIADSIRLIVKDPIDPRSSGSKGLKPLEPQTILSSNVWLSITVPGYARDNPYSAATVRAVSEAKKCLYFFSRFCVFRRSHAWRDGPSAKATISSPLGETSLSLPYGLGQMLHSLLPDLQAESTMESRTTVLKEELKLVSSFFRASSHMDYRALSAAIEWYIDSVTADNQTLAYLAACIGLEAVLGYGDSSGQMDSMSARLGDRYGWLLGEGRADREKLTEDFKSMLNLRGKLVHARVSRLSADEQQRLHDVQDMLSSVIDKEIGTMLHAPHPYS